LLDLEVNPNRGSADVAFGHEAAVVETLGYIDGHNLVIEYRSTADRIAAASTVALAEQRYP